MPINKEYKVVCVKNFIDNECNFYKNNIYNVEKTLYKTKSNNKEVFIIAITDDNGNISQCHSTSTFYEDYILTHFSILKDLRKQKLKKINNEL
jgi:hypothetical protein